MPEPGDLIVAFSPQPERCFRMVQSVQLQATHCHEPPAWKGTWRDAKGTHLVRGGLSGTRAKADQRGVGGLLFGPGGAENPRPRTYVLPIDQEIALSVREE
jgi:hypothetical protein